MKIVGIVALIATALTASAGNAAAFDCRKFLSQGGLGDLKLNKAYLVLPNKEEIRAGSDLVNLNLERSIRARGILAEDEFEIRETSASAPIAMKCRVLKAGLKLGKDSPRDLFLQLAATDPKPEKNADLLIFQFRAVPTQTWPLNIPVLIGGKTRQPSLTIEQSSFFKLLKENDKSSSGQFVVLSAMNPNAKNELPAGVRPGENSLAAAALALCEPFDCAALIARVNADAKGANEPPSLGAQAGSPPAQTSPAKSPPIKTENKQVVLPGDPQPSAPSIELVVRDGTKDGAPALTEAETGGLACLLDALGPELFDPRPECTRPLNEKWRGGKYRVRPNGKNEWVIELGRPLVPKRLEVRLPPGQDGVQCKISATYVSQAGAAITLDLPPSDKQAKDQPRRQALFEASLPRPPEISGGAVNVRVNISDAAACGAGGTRGENIAVQSETLSIDLAATAPGTSELIYLMMFNDVGHQAGTRELSVLGTAMLDSVLTAHRRASYFRKSQPWSLVRARIGIVLPNSGAETLAESAGTELRASGTFGTSNRTSSSEIGSRYEKFTLGSDVIVRGLRKMGPPQARIDRVYAILIGSADRPGILNEPHDACNPELYVQVRREFDDGKGPGMEIFSFPIVRMNDSTRLKSNAFEPVEFNPGMPEFSGRIMRCTNLPEGINIYPYLAESWRDPEDNARRFGIAASDRIGVLLDEILNNRSRRAGSR